MHGNTFGLGSRVVWVAGCWVALGLVWGAAVRPAWGQVSDVADATVVEEAAAQAGPATPTPGNQPKPQPRQMPTSGGSGGGGWETPGFYGLLDAVSVWGGASSASPWPVTGALGGERLAGLVLNPAGHVGESAALDGRLQQVVVLPLQRASQSRGGSVTRWAVLLGDKAEQDGDDVVVLVYLWDPEGHWAQAKPGGRVQVDGLFLKTQGLPAQTGQVEMFPAFVGRVVEQGVTPPRPVTGRQDGAMRPAVLLVVMLAMVVFGVLGLYLVRKMKKPLAVRTRTMRHKVDADEDVDDTRADLPEDPAEALAQLDAEGGGEDMDGGRQR